LSTNDLEYWINKFLEYADRGLREFENEIFYLASLEEELRRTQVPYAGSFICRVLEEVSDERYDVRFRFGNNEISINLDNLINERDISTVKSILGYDLEWIRKVFRSFLNLDLMDKLFYDFIYHQDIPNEVRERLEKYYSTNKGELLKRFDARAKSRSDYILNKLLIPSLERKRFPHYNYHGNIKAVEYRFPENHLNYLEDELKTLILFHEFVQEIGRRSTLSDLLDIVPTFKVFVREFINIDREGSDAKPPNDYLEVYNLIERCGRFSEVFSYEERMKFRHSITESENYEELAKNLSRLAFEYLKRVNPEVLERYGIREPPSEEFFELNRRERERRNIT